MMAGLSFSEPTTIYLSNSFLACGITVTRKPIIVIGPTIREKYNKITASSSGGSSIILDNKELEFKTSFDEYLKAMESIKVDRANTNTSSRKTKVVKKTVKEKEGSNGNVKPVRESFSKRRVVVREDARNGSLREEIDAKKVQNKENGLSGKKSSIRRGEEHILHMDRAAFGSLDNGDDVVDKPRVSRRHMEERIQTLAKCLNGADIDMPEWKFSEMMRSAQIRFSDHSIVRIVQILGRYGNWRRVLQVIEWIRSRERFKSYKIRHVYTAALDALGKARRPVESFNLFRIMLDQTASYPDSVAYHCIAVTLGQAGHMKELFDVIDTMRSPPRKKFKPGIFGTWDPRLEPDVIVYNAVINACIHRKKWEGAFWVLQQISEKGLQPSCATYGLCMELMLACEKYDLVHDFFRKVQKSYIPNALVYKVLVNTLWKEGKTDEAISAVEDMERRGIVGNAGLYYDLARCLCSAGRCQDALQQVEKICKVANKPLVVTYTGLIQACLDSSDIQSGAYIFKHMQKFCSPNLVTCNIMLKAFLDHGMFEEAKQLFLKLLENGNFIRRGEDCGARVVPDIYSFNTMLDGCAMWKKWDDLEFVYQQMLKYGHHFNAKRHLKLVLDARRAGKVELLEMTWTNLVKTARDLPTLIITEMFCMRLEQEDYAAAISCFVKCVSDESQLSSRKFWLKFFRENADRIKQDRVNGLVDEVRVVLGRSENLALENLMRSCEEFSRTQKQTSREVDFVLM